MRAVVDLDLADMTERRRLRANLIGLRYEQGLSQRALAEILGIGQPAVVGMEAATRWRTPTVQRWARALGHEIVFEVAGLPMDDTTTLLDAVRPADPTLADRWVRQQLHAVLVAARRELGLTQADLAARIGVSRSAMHAVEAGGDDLTVATLQRQARVLDGELRFRLVRSEAVADAAV